MNRNTLYSEIEDLIIRWSIDGTKTAGSLTRQILEVIETYEQPIKPSPIPPPPPPPSNRYLREGHEPPKPKNYPF